MTEWAIDALGAIAGAIWISAALYFRFLKSGLHLSYVIVLFSIGTALMLLSSALAPGIGPGAVEVLAVVGNLLLILTGCVVWVLLDWSIDEPRTQKHE